MAGQLAKFVRWYSPSELLVMATGDTAALLASSGPRAPYDGRLGVIEPGAFADLLVVDGDPTTDAALLADPERKFRVIVKDGRILQGHAGLKRSPSPRPRITVALS